MEIMELDRDFSLSRGEHQEHSEEYDSRYIRSESEEEMEEMRKTIQLDMEMVKQKLLELLEEANAPKITPRKRYWVWWCKMSCDEPQPVARKGSELPIRPYFSEESPPEQESDDLLSEDSQVREEVPQGCCLDRSDVTSGDEMDTAGDCKEHLHTLEPGCLTVTADSTPGSTSVNLRKGQTGNVKTLEPNRSSIDSGRFSICSRNTQIE